MKSRQVLSMLLALVMVVGLFAGCGGKGTSDTPPADQTSSSANTETSGGKPVTIQWWTPNWDEKESREMADEFNQLNPDINVELVITDWDSYKSKVTTAISGKNAPELHTVLLTDAVPLAKQGYLAPLNDIGAAAGIDFDDITAPALEIMSDNGNIYGVPFRYDGSGIYYNVDILEAAGYTEFPTTWDEMVAMSKDLAQDGRYAFAWPLGNQANAATRLVQQIYTYGGDVLNTEETECLLNSDAAKKALTNIVSSIEEGYASPSSAELDNTKMRDQFGSGHLAFNFTGPFDIETLKEDYPDLNFKTAVIPGDKGMGTTTANGWGVVMAENAVNKEAAAKFLAYITTAENQARLTDSLPASQTALDFEQFATEDLKPFGEQLQNSKPEPTYVRWAEMEPIIYGYIQNAVSGAMTVDEACEGMTADINALLAV